MFSVLLKHRFLTGMILLFLVLSILCQIIIGVLYQRMIRESDNMAATANKYLKQCKLKFINCFQLNEGIVNIQIFVDKFLNRISIAGVTFMNLGHISGQFMLLSVFFSGIGICLEIIDGASVAELLPFYMISFLGLYAYFSITSLVDFRGKRSIVRTNVIDYLENHMVNHLQLVSEEKVQEEIINEKKSRQSVFTGNEEKELAELLKEFLV